MSFSHFQQQRTPLSHRICDMLELDEDICRKCGYIEIISNYCALVDGCTGILEYDDSCVKLSIGKKSVCFHGNSLTIKSLSMEQAMVEGTILHMEFC